MDTHEKVRAQFGRTAAAYVSSPTHAEGDELSFMVRLAGDLAGKEVLDVATGGGHTALAFARAGARVMATDLTPEMLEAARTFVQGEVGRAVRFQLAAAEDLPFEGASFEVVTCRIAAHHFADPRRFVGEAARVLRPGGLLMLVDNVAPEAPELGAAMNRIERLRDPSHVEAYPVSRWVGWFAAAGLELYHLSRWYTHKPFRAWLDRAGTPQAEGERLEGYVLRLPDAFKRYFRVVKEDGRLQSLSHEAVLMVGRLEG